MIRRFCFFLFLGVLFTACHVDRHTGRLMRQADSLLATCPDSAWCLLQELQTVRMPRRDAARYALLWAQATNKCVKPLSPCDSLLELALAYYDTPSPQRALALLYKGRLEDEMGLPKEATRWLQEALTLTERYPEEVETRRHVLSSLGNLYFYSANYDEAIKLYRELYDCCTTDKDKAIALSHIASYYSVKEQRDSSNYIRKKALDYALASKDSLITSSILLSMSIYSMDYDSSLYYARWGIEQIPANASRGNHYYNLGTLLSEDEAYVDTALACFNIALADTTFSARFYCLLDLAELEEEKSDYQTANSYLWRYINHADSLLYSEQSTPMIQLIHEYQTKMRVREEQIRGQRIWGSIIGCIMILFFVVIIGFQYRLSKKKQEQQEYEQQLIQTREKIATLQTTIDNNEVILSLLRQEQQQKIIEISEREGLIEKLREEKNALQIWLFNQNAIYKKVQSLRKQWIGGNKGQKVLNAVEQDKLKEALFNIYAAQVKAWKSYYPRLTEDDIVLLCLQEAGCDSQSIAISFGYSDTHAINQRKSRMKKRMEHLKTQV